MGQHHFALHLLNNIYYEMAQRGRGPQSWVISHSQPFEQARRDLPRMYYDLFLAEMKKFNDDNGISEWLKSIKSPPKAGCDCGSPMCTWTGSFHCRKFN